ncbi:hypothetical protein ABK040_004047 [Willaertia magna]
MFQQLFRSLLFISSLLFIFTSSTYCTIKIIGKEKQLPQHPQPWPSRFYASIIEWNKETGHYALLQMWYIFTQPTSLTTVKSDKIVCSQKLIKTDLMTSLQDFSLSYFNTSYYYDPFQQTCDKHITINIPPPYWMVDATLVNDEPQPQPCPNPSTLHPTNGIHVFPFNITMNSANEKRLCYHWRKGPGEYWTDAITNLPYRYNFFDSVLLNNNNSDKENQQFYHYPFFTKAKKSFSGVWWFVQLREIQETNGYFDLNSILRLPTFCNATHTVATTVN